MDFDEIFLNAILVEFVGTVFITFYSLVFIGKYHNSDYRIKGNVLLTIIKIILPSIATMVVFTHYIRVNSIYYIFLCIITLTFFIWLSHRDRGIKSILLGTTVSVSIMLLIKVIGLLFMTHIIGVDVLRTDYKLMLSGYILTPERVIEFSILYFIYLGNSPQCNKNYIRILNENKKVRNIMLMVYSVNLIISIIILKYFIYGKQMLFVSRETQGIVTSCLTLLMLINISAPWSIIKSIKDKNGMP